MRINIEENLGFNSAAEQKRISSHFNCQSWRRQAFHERGHWRFCKQHSNQFDIINNIIPSQAPLCSGRAAAVKCSLCSLLKHLLICKLSLSGGRCGASPAHGLKFPLIDGAVRRIALQTNLSISLSLSFSTIVSSLLKPEKI